MNNDRQIKSRISVRIFSGGKKGQMCQRKKCHMEYNLSCRPGNIVYQYDG